MKKYKPMLTWIRDGVTLEPVVGECYHATNDFGVKHHIKGFMQEDPDGEWVRWEDVKLTIAANLLEEGVKEFGCNCEEMLTKNCVYEEDGLLKIREYWICPAHGYKKR